MADYNLAERLSPAAGRYVKGPDDRLEGLSQTREGTGQRLLAARLRGRRMDARGPANGMNFTSKMGLLLGRPP